MDDLEDREVMTIACATGHVDNIVAREGSSKNMNRSNEPNGPLFPTFYIADVD